MDNENRCSPNTVVSGGITVGFGGILFGVSIIVIILIAVLKGLNIFVISDAWFIALFIIMASGIFIGLIGYSVSALCAKDITKDILKEAFD